LVETMAGFLPEARRPAFKAQVVDFSMVRVQVENKAFDRESLIDLAQHLGAALMQLESPFQAARTREWLDELNAKTLSDRASFQNEIIACLSHLFDKCDILRTEIENVTLQVVRGTEIQHLESDIFLRMLKTGILRVDVTKQWLHMSEHGGDVEIAVIEGMARLLKEKVCLSLEKCPEPLQCDLPTLQNFQSGLQGAALIGLVAIIITPFFPPNTTPDEASSLFSEVSKETEEVRPKLSQICEIVERGVAAMRHAKNVPPVEFQRLDDALEKLKKCLDEDDPVFRLLHDRACKAYIAALGPSKEHISCSCLGESPWTLRYAAEHLNGLRDRTWTFLTEHLNVYRVVYSELLKPDV